MSIKKLLSHPTWAGIGVIVAVISLVSSYYLNKANINEKPPVQTNSSTPNSSHSENKTRNIETINYGTRMGMEVTIIAKRGINTRNSIIETEHTRDNAIAFCRDYASDAKEQCIQRELNVKLAKEVSANCETGYFTNFYGHSLEFEGINTKNPEGTKYIIRDRKTENILDGSFASGYPINLDIFRELCPDRFLDEY